MLPIKEGVVKSKRIRLKVRSGHSFMSSRSFRWVFEERSLSSFWACRIGTSNRSLESFPTCRV